MPTRSDRAAVFSPACATAEISRVFFAPIVAAGCGYFLGSSQHHRDAVAFFSGVIGTLIGADLLNLRKLRDLGAPVASVGAGTFDGIFLTGIVAVLLA